MAERIHPETVEKIRGYYSIICNKESGHDLQERVNIIRYLEKVLRTDFKNTEDFHQKMDAFFMRHDKLGGGRLIERQNELSWPNEVMAKYLRISTSYLSRMKNDNVNLNNLAVQLINQSDEKVISEAKRRKIL